MANIMTVSRMILSIWLLFSVPLSSKFYFLYIVCGLTDMLDGYIARRTGTESRLGEKLDSLADILFVIVCLIKILPIVHIEMWLWAWILIIAVIKVMNIICGLVYQKRFIMLHTTANKITGFLLFLLPLFLDSICFRYVSAFICVIATFAAIQEGNLIFQRKCD